MATFDAQLAPFELSTAVVLITGGSSGIGLGLVDEFIAHGSRVLISGRREAELQKVQQKHGKDKVLHYYVGSTGKEEDRIRLFQQATKDHPDLNVLINNAGILRHQLPQSAEIAQPWSVRQEEIDINISGPIHLTSLFIPHLLQLGKDKPAAIINVTSGLAFAPYCKGPVYSATKAAIHSWTAAMRPLLADTNVRLVELIPPAVKSNLGGGNDWGVDCDEFCKAMVAQFASGKLEFGYQTSEQMRMADRKALDERMLHIQRSMKAESFQQL